MRTGSIAVFLALFAAMSATSLGDGNPAAYRRISVREYRDKMKAGWLEIKCGKDASLGEYVW